mgnify:CR=1 FL=1
MKLNIDQIKESLQKTKEYISNDLSEEEDKEINLYIDTLIKNLQEKIKKIDIVNLSESIKQYIKENEDV